VSKFIPWLKERATKLNDSGSEEANKQPQFSPRLSVKQMVTPIKRLTNQMKSNRPSNKPLGHYWFITLVSGGAIAFLGVWWSIERSLPPTAELFTSVRNQTLTIKAADGTILQQIGPATREQLELEEMPNSLVQAFIASEDRRFYQHQGIDFQGIVRASFSNLRSANLVEGGSTITQQLARILFLNQERTFWRKIKEVRLAGKIEHNLSKQQILERYLNLVYLGEGAYGVADAAWVYFSKPVSQLTLSEMATIAGLAPAPSLYSPAANLAAAQQRRNLVLQRMREDGVITAEAAAAASSTPLVLNPSPPKRLQVEAPYFTTYIQKELPKYISPEVLEAGGLTIETTLNPKWQKAAEDVVQDTVASNGRWQNFEQAALVSIDPRNGEIKALVGGKDFGKNQFNRVTQAQRQPGSTFKGFVYTAAIASGMSPYKSYVDAPLIVEGYEPKNYNRDFRGRLSMRDALSASINVVALKVLLDVGFEPTIKLAQQMGIKSQLHPTYSLALGSSEVNLLELTSAYGTLATQGVHTQAHGIRRILNRSGEIVYAAESKPKRVLDPGSAAIATWMLRNVVQAGTGGAAQLADRPVAGKTGTSDESRDLWFIGYIPQLVTGVWLGNDNNQPTWGSSSTAAYTWRKFMVQAVEEMPVEKFPERPKLEGRKGSIKAKPIKPKHVISGRKERSGAFGRQTVEESSENYRSSGRRRYRRRSRQQQQNQSPSTSVRRSRPNRVEEPPPDVNESERYNRLLQRLQQKDPVPPRTESVPRRRDRPPVIVQPLPPTSTPQSRSPLRLESDD
jgi:penicillin-binding protein 1A